MAGQDDVKDVIQQLLEQKERERRAKQASKKSATHRQRAEVKSLALQSDPDHQAGSGDYRFLNPYNFVRPMKPVAGDQEPLLGRCPPPPHDRYVGLTGRIYCELTAVTPLFVSDSECIDPSTVNGKTHLSYRFFRTPDGEIAIPATSLRGAIRAIFEAATNSCFAHFAGEKRLSYHLSPGDALRLVPGRVRKVSEDRWELDLLPGTTPVSPNARPAGPQYAAWVHCYRPLWASRTVAKTPTSPYSQRVKLSLAGWKHGDACQAVIELCEHPLRRFEFWNVVALLKPGDPRPKLTQQQRLVEGFLCITNQNIENKHDERFFFRAPENKSAQVPLPLSEEVRREYEDLIADYQERHRDELNKRLHPGRPAGQDPAFSRFIIEPAAKTLADGDLVYAMLEQRGSGLAVRFIVPVSVPRVAYKRTIGQLLEPPELKTCDRYEALCPACRTFGWVRAGKGENGEPGAYAGRVRFSHATRVSTAPDPLPDMSLAILSSPKPTTTRFYLAPRKDKPRSGRDDAQVGYDAPGQTLRGRKVYRHHGARLIPHEYRRDGLQSDQNRSVREVQAPGTRFCFTVDFENLASEELGALLWALEMEGWHHRIGFARPLGFGSVTITVTELEILSPKERYTGLERSGWRDALASKERWINAFKQAAARRYGKSFDQLDSIRDLRALLAGDPPLPIHYPRSTPEPQAEGKNYEWFVGNKRSGKESGPRLELPLAADDTEGLPLIDRFGKEVRQ